MRKDTFRGCLNTNVGVLSTTVGRTPSKKGGGCMTT